MEKNLLLTELVDIVEELADAVADYVHDMVDGEHQADVDGRRAQGAARLRAVDCRTSYGSDLVEIGAQRAR